MVDHIEDAIPASSGAEVGRLADVHMWSVRDGSTSRLQAFRDESGRTYAVTTRRPGDHGPGHVNSAEMFRSGVWMEFFAQEKDAPTLIANVLDPMMKFEDSARIVTLHFDEYGEFIRHVAADPADIETLNRLGVEWDAGAGFVPYVPPPPTRALVWRLFPVADLPARNLFRDMWEYMTTDWGQAVDVAVAVVTSGADDVPDDLPADVTYAARTLLRESVELGRDEGQVWWINGQHRTEAMKRQGVAETLLRDQRGIDEPPLPGELGIIVLL